jgi:hypothetical protein
MFRENSKVKIYNIISEDEKYFGDNRSGIDILTDKCLIPIEEKKQIYILVNLVK